MLRETGTVKNFNDEKGWGFITRPDKADVFVHFRDIESQGRGRRSLKQGQRVSFCVEDAERGPKAIEVRVEA